jgi:hypothetical protein
LLEGLEHGPGIRIDCVEGSKPIIFRRVSRRFDRLEFETGWHEHRANAKRVTHTERVGEHE